MEGYCCNDCCKLGNIDYIVFFYWINFDIFKDSVNDIVLCLDVVRFMGLVLASDTERQDNFNC